MDENMIYGKIPELDINENGMKVKDIENKANGKWDDVKRSKPFWGNMMSLIFRKN